MSKRVIFDVWRTLSEGQRFMEHPYHKGPWFASELYFDLRQTLMVPSSGITRAFLEEISGK